MFHTRSAGPSPAGPKHAHYEPRGGSSLKPPSNDHCTPIKWGGSIPVLVQYPQRKKTGSELKVFISRSCLMSPDRRCLCSFRLEECGGEIREIPASLLLEVMLLGMGYISARIPTIRGILSSSGHFSPHPTDMENPCQSHSRYL